MLQHNYLRMIDNAEVEITLLNSNGAFEQLILSQRTRYRNWVMWKDTKSSPFHDYEIFVLRSTAFLGFKKNVPEEKNASME